MYLAVGTGVFLLSYWVGATAIELSDEEANATVQEFTERVQGIEQEGIFSNNALIGLGMFIPAAGVGLGIYSAFSTGIIFNAFAQVNPAISLMSPLSALFTPFGILELFAYGLGVSRSGILAYDLAKRRPWKTYLIVTLLEMAIAVAALVIGAFVETHFIQNS